MVYRNTKFMNELADGSDAVLELIYQGDEVTFVHCSWSPAGLVRTNETKFPAYQFPVGCLDPKFQPQA